MLQRLQSCRIVRDRPEDEPYRRAPSSPKFESWTLGEKLVLVKNPRYWGKKALVDRLIFRPVADNAARLQALQTGELNLYDLVDPQDFGTVSKTAA